VIQIYATRLPKTIENGLLNEMLQYIHMEKRERIKRYIHKEDAYRSLIGELLVRIAICRRLEIMNSDILYTYNSFGKPYLPKKFDLFFNATHSGEWVACIIDNKEVGIDIQEIQALDYEVVKHVFSVEQSKEFKKMDRDRQIEFFYEIWALKESYIKFDGRGLFLPLEAIQFYDETDIKIPLYQDAKLDNCYLKLYSIDPGYKLSVCAKTYLFPKKVTIIEYEEIISELGKLIVFCN